MRQKDEALKLKKYEEILENAYKSEHKRQRRVLNSIERKEQASLSAQQEKARKWYHDQNEFEKKRLQYVDKVKRPNENIRVRSQELRNKIMQRELKIVHKQLEEEKLTRKAILIKLNAEKRKHELQL